ncbi:MAG: ribonuclease HII [bacterium]|nr:ribonuclease HII [bacterium]
MKYVIGVDEAGRGPLAGPVAVGVVAVPEGFDVLTEFPGVKDSKKLSEKKREKIFERLVALAGMGDPSTTSSLRSAGYGAGVRFTVEFESADVIDEDGIATAVRRALSRGVNTLAPDSALVHIQLDGALRAPPEYSQETIINGDELVPLISLASIAAKVMRDRLMVELAKKYPEYGFEKHKGYGTAMHYEMLKKHGLCDIHRRSFIHLDLKPK